MDWSRSDTERLLAVFVGFLSMITSGSTYAFGAFTNAVKSHFNYTQSEGRLSMTSFFFSKILVIHLFIPILYMLLLNANIINLILYM